MTPFLTDADREEFWRHIWRTVLELATERLLRERGMRAALPARVRVDRIGAGPADWAEDYRRRCAEKAGNRPPYDPDETFRGISEALDRRFFYQWAFAGIDNGWLPPTPRWPLYWERLLRPKLPPWLKRGPRRKVTAKTVGDWLRRTVSWGALMGPFAAAGAIVTPYEVEGPQWL